MAEQEPQNDRVRLLVLNDYLTFDRKLYQFMGLPLGRPIPFKALLYFVPLLVLFLGVYFAPIISNLINWIPIIYVIIAPIVIAYLLTDTRTESRLPLSFFRSVFKYLWRKSKRVTYIKGKEIKKPSSYQIEGYTTVTLSETRSLDDFSSSSFKLDVPKSKKKQPKITTYSEGKNNQHLSPKQAKKKAKKQK